MFIKLQKNGEMVFGLLAGDMFLDGECGSWSEELEPFYGGHLGKSQQSLCLRIMVPINAIKY